MLYISYHYKNFLRSLKNQSSRRWRRYLQLLRFPIPTFQPLPRHPTCIVSDTPSRKPYRLRHLELCNGIKPHYDARPVMGGGGK